MFAVRMLKPKWPVVAALLLFFLGLLPSQALAGPYYKLDPHPVHLRFGLGLETTGQGGVGGGTIHADFKVAHLNERYSVHIGARGHGYFGPFSDNIGETFHLGGFAVARWQIQVDSIETISPYVLLGPGLLSYNGHPDKDGNDAQGLGPALETDVGLLGQLSPRLAWFAELGLIAGYPRAVYMRFNGGIQYAFGSDGIMKEPK